MKKFIPVVISAGIFMSCKHLEKHIGGGSAARGDRDVAIAAIKSADSSGIKLRHAILQKTVELLDGRCHHDATRRKCMS